MLPPVEDDLTAAIHQRRGVLYQGYAVKIGALILKRSKFGEVEVAGNVAAAHVEKLWENNRAADCALVRNVMTGLAISSTLVAAGGRDLRSITLVSVRVAECPTGAWGVQGL